MSRIILAIVFMLLFGCNTPKNENNINESEIKNKINNKYAKSFNIELFDNYKVLTVSNPWQGVDNIKYKYILAKKGVKLPDDIAGEIIRLPIKRVICLSTTHVAMLSELNKVDNIVGISGAKYITNSIIREKIKTNEVYDIGYESSLNYELITALKPDLVITYGVNGEIAGYINKLRELGISTVIIAEYLESSLLGKAEWLKFVAAFFDCNDLANRKFSKIEREYIQLKKKVENIEIKPTVLSSLPWKDVWYIPGGKSFQAKLIEDAGGNYLWKDKDSRESIPLSIESVFSKAQNADIWINTGSANSAEQILGVDERFKNFKSFKQNMIFNNNKQLNINGGNDYWETGVLRPQIILKDMIKIFHPEIFPNYNLHYYNHLD